MKRRPSLSRLLALGLLTLFGASAPALAQTSPRPLPLPSFGRGLAASDDATAIVNNPANLAFMPGAELRWSSLYLHEAALVPYQGHAFSFATPLPFLSLATGLRLDLVDPPADLAALSPTFRSNYQWLSWALAFRMGSLASFGLNWKHSYSEVALVDGIGAWSFAIDSRPSDYFGLAFVAEDIGGPSSDSGQDLPGAYDAALAFRPLGTRALELGLEWKYVADGGGYYVPRGTLGIDIPTLGRLRGEFSMNDVTEKFGERSWLASAVMSFAFNGATGSLEVSGGSVFGDGLGDGAKGKAHDNVAVDVAFKGYREASASELPPYALRIRLEDTPGPREHVALLRHLWWIAEREPSVAAVVLELRSAPAGSLAHVQELRDAVHYLRVRGKQVLCHLEDAGGAALYLCSAANRVLLNPAGGIRFAGLRATHLYYKNLLDKLGIRADFVRIGDHKSAPEAFMREGASEVAQKDMVELMQQIERFFTLGVAGGRRIDPETLRSRIRTGPFIAKEALSAKLVDGLAFDDEIEQKLAESLGGSVPLVDSQAVARAPDQFGAVQGIALIYVDGDMVDGRSEVIPLLGNRIAGSYTIAESIKQARENPKIGAIVLRIETGGGSALAADVIWRQLAITAKVKPVVVSMGAIAASGGYYIASPGTRVFANPLTITGSIGIFYGKADIAELLRRIGVNVETYTTAPRADAESIYRPYTAEERQELVRKVGQFYDQFLARVASGRRLTKAQVDAVGQGHVWTGEQAQARKLVDELGGLRQALAAARRHADLPEHAPIYELPVVETSLLGRVLGVEGLHATMPTEKLLPKGMLELARALAPFAIHPPDMPLARIEIALPEF